MKYAYLTASGNIVSALKKVTVYKLILGGPTAVGSAQLMTGGTGGTSKFIAHYPISETVDVCIPGIVADYVNITGTTPSVIVGYM